MIEKVLIISVVSFLLFPRISIGQKKFDERINEIKLQLDTLSETSIPGLQETAEFSVVNASLQELLRGVAEVHNLNVNISPDLNEQITNNFTNVLVKDLIIFLCKKYRLDIEFISNILSFKSFETDKAEPKKKNYSPKITYDKNNDLFSVDLMKDSLSLVIREIVRLTDKNIILAPGVEHRLMRGTISNLPFVSGLNKIAFANNLILEETDEDNFFILSDAKNRIEKSTNNKINPIRNGLTRKDISENKEKEQTENLFVGYGIDSLLSIEAYNVQIADVISEAASLLKKDYIFFSIPNGTTYVNINNLSFDKLLDFLLSGTDYTYILQAGVYLIGNRLDEGFRTTKLVKFQYRPVWEIQESIPTQITENVQIILFEELNGLILSGSSQRIKEIENFLKEIDQPVPNIMINVMVMEVRKTRTKETGISAVFSTDSIPKTGGQVLSGVDLTFGANSVNSLLDKLQKNNIVNLGRVTPNFYMNIKALEQNGDVNIESTPKLSTLNGHEALLTIGRSVYYQESTQNVTGGVNPIITTSPRFNKVDANLTIAIKPIVSGDDNITLDIDAEFSDFIPPEIENAPPGNATRKFVSQIRVENEEVILLGGLEEVSKDRLHSGVPFLSRIPILKWIFSSNKTSDSDSKLLILIRPEIVY